MESGGLIYSKTINLPLVYLIFPQTLHEKVKEGNLDPREQSVAMEAQVCSLLCFFSLADLAHSLLPLLSACSICFPTEERLP